MAAGQKVDIFENYFFLNFEYFGKTIAMEKFKNDRILTNINLNIQKMDILAKINEKSKIEILKITVFAKNIHWIEKGYYKSRYRDKKWIFSSLWTFSKMVIFEAWSN